MFLFSSSKYSNGNVVMYNRGKFDEFTHAYAISVHKSQGSEYANVIVVIPSNMKRMLYNKLLYTAVTRAKKGLVVIGSIDSFNYAVHQEYSDNRNTSLKTFFQRCDMIDFFANILDMLPVTVIMGILFIYVLKRYLIREMKMVLLQ